MADPTPRQLEVFEAVCRLGSQKAAAHALGMSVRGVEDTLTRMYRRMGVKGMGQAAYAIWGQRVA